MGVHGCFLLTLPKREISSSFIVRTNDLVLSLVLMFGQMLDMGIPGKLPRRLHPVPQEVNLARDRGL